MCFRLFVEWTGLRGVNYIDDRYWFDWTKLTNQIAGNCRLQINKCFPRSIFYFFSCSLGFFKYTLIFCFALNFFFFFFFKHGTQKEITTKKIIIWRSGQNVKVQFTIILMVFSLDERSVKKKKQLLHKNFQFLFISN